MTGMIDPRIADWLASGDTGVSSKAIMLWLSAQAKCKTWGAETPADPGDLGRCLRLLERIPEWKPRMAEMAEAGGLWPTYAARWEDMAGMMRDEVGIDWSKGKQAPRTFALMQRVYVEAYRAAGYIVETDEEGHLRSASRPPAPDRLQGEDVGV